MLVKLLDAAMDAALMLMLLSPNNDVFCLDSALDADDAADDD